MASDHCHRLVMVRRVGPLYLRTAETRYADRLEEAVGLFGTWIRRHAVRVADYRCCPRAVEW